MSPAGTHHISKRYGEVRGVSSFILYAKSCNIATAFLKNMNFI